MVRGVIASTNDAAELMRRELVVYGTTIAVVLSLQAEVLGGRMAYQWCTNFQKKETHLDTR